MTTSRPNSPIKQNRLGRDGFEVSSLGFGGWALGGQWGVQDDSESVAALEKAIASGINFIDTAPGYGDGRSEHVIADMLSQLPPQVRETLHVATKTPPSAGPWPPSPYCRWQDRYSAAYIRSNVEERLKNLKTDCLDLLQLHTWTRAWNDDPQPLLVLQKLREEGKIRKIGVCTPEQDQNCVVQLMRDGLVDVVQIVFNLFEQEPAAQLLPVAEETGTGVIVRVSLDEGGLTGKYGADHQFPDDDFRSTYFGGDRMQRTADRVAEISADLEDLGLTDDYSLADAAIKFSQSHPAVSTVIVGMRNPEQAAKNVAAAGLPDFTPEVLQRLRRHQWLRGVWYGGK
ncbi:aryl-alcohol dehydrogenase-like predicted oxidoreductase [Rhodopirellula rubra]|uniref:Aryl-alcohol dehydrogenase-like predicted oxidoreductase n=1 Tax=Aporhodopirellula rubra TaxID=980271 RepID=A0A7W5H8W7_9BACT|nr:aldo/keto reductase [Aporhodopirellula rubra]MBB3209515.1 aryl-alcohol dehydrogenase-like predicted oxidoreductase [Aporhodopirellula rubra]